MGERRVDKHPSLWMIMPLQRAAAGPAAADASS
jgi:hypothetical protein